jgi:nucleoside 2-deoxyribosyltransferase
MATYKRGAPNPKKRLYLAGPLFSDAERAFNVFVRNKLLRHASVFLPQEDGELLTTLLKAGMGHFRASRRIFKTDLAAINKCDAIVAILDGRAVDEGVAFELGVAFGLGKLRVGLQTDPRRLLPSGNNPMIDCALDKIFRKVDDLEDWLELWAQSSMKET